MGICGSSTSEADKKAEKVNREIDRQNRVDQRKDEQIIKLLLLGAGESGKSTIFKQMKILYGKDYTPDELKSMKPVVYSNVNWNMRQILEAAEPLEQEIADKELMKQFLENVKDETPVVGEHAELLKKLWADEGVQKLWEMRSLYQVLDGFAYFADDLDRVSAADYMPNKRDVLLSRVRTSGIVEEKYIIGGVNFTMFDVGGQRNERKKWIHCFDNVTAVIFVAAINEYDQKLFEDSTTNRIDEAVHLFADICNNSWFKKTAMILFLNKRDIFEEKIFVHPLRVAGERHDAFEGPYANDPGVSKEDAIVAAEKYMTKLFRDVNEDPSKEIYPHVTCATDTKNVQVVFEACKDIILKSNLMGSGFMG